MNKKGFTLIEIIISLVLIIGLSTITIVNLSNKDDKELYEITQKILDAANVYINVEKDGNGNTYQYGILNGGKGVYISLENLVDKGYIKSTYLDEIKEKTGDDKLQLLAVNAINSSDSIECEGSLINFNVSWDKDNSLKYLCPYTSSSKNTVSITYDLNYPETSEGENVYTYNVEKNKEINISLFMPTYENYIFLHWEDEKGYKFDSTTYGATNDLKLIAVWKEKSKHYCETDPTNDDCKSLYNTIKNSRECIPNFNITPNKKGIYERLVNNGDRVKGICDAGNGNYFYAGDIDNNFVKFQGNNKLFRIVKTVDDITGNNVKEIQLVYTNTVSPTNIDNKKFVWTGSRIYLFDKDYYKIPSDYYSYQDILENGKLGYTIDKPYKTCRYYLPEEKDFTLFSDSSITLNKNSTSSHKDCPANVEVNSYYYLVFYLPLYNWFNSLETDIKVLTLEYNFGGSFSNEKFGLLNSYNDILNNVYGEYCIGYLNYWNENKTDDLFNGSFNEFTSGLSPVYASISGCTSLDYVIIKLRPSIVIDGDLRVISGSGTESDPYIVTN